MITVPHGVIGAGGQALEFRGSLEDLQALVASIGEPGHWLHRGAFESFVLDDETTNLTLNWWPSSGTLTLVGDPAEREWFVGTLRQALSEREAGG